MRNLQHIFILILSLTPLCNLLSQGESLFDDAVVHEVHLTFDDANYWETLSSNYDNNYPDVGQLNSGFYVLTITNQKTKMFVTKKLTIHKP